MRAEPNAGPDYGTPKNVRKESHVKQKLLGRWMILCLQLPAGTLSETGWHIGN